MKKTHFPIAYAGNKRSEVELIEHFINSNTNYDKITTIVEPYCGTGAFSYYMSVKYPKRFKYILNDNDENLMMLYFIFQDEIRLLHFINELKEKCENLDKEKYLTLVKENNFLAWFLGRYIYNIRPCLFPIDDRHISKIRNIDKLLECPFLKFIRNEEITFLNMDALNLYSTIKDDSECLIFLDPPYLESCNDYYSKSMNVNIYEYLVNNKIENEKSTIVLCLENNWIIKLMFQNYICQVKEKEYLQKHKKTEHITIINIKA